MQPQFIFDEEQASRYEDNFAPIQAIRDVMHLLVLVALKKLPERARILCVGAGTGLELSEMALKHPDWVFTAVEPSSPMLRRCRERARREGWEARCSFHEGTLATLAPQEPYHAATSLLVSHFLVDREQRRSFLAAIHTLVYPGGKLLLADLAPEPGDSGLVSFWVDLMDHSNLGREALAHIPQALGKDYGNLGASLLPSLLQEAGWSQVVRIGQWGCIYLWQAERP